VDAHTAPEWGTAALLTVDLQCDLLDGAPFCIEGTSAAVPAALRVANVFRAAGRPVVHLVRLYAPDGDDVDRPRRTEVAAGRGMLTPGTDGSQLVPGLPPAPIRLDAERLMAGAAQEVGPQELILFKPRWGGFYRTGLHEHLSALGVTTVVVAGCNFPNCPRTTVYEASERDYRVVMVTDAISGLYPKGEQEMDGIGVALVTAAEVEAALDELAANA
jgi:nicotinamidase-related amidase